MSIDIDNNNWFSNFTKTSTFKDFKKSPVAYFCAEYALTADIYSYAGGLGILAGDLLKEAGIQDFPFVAVGLYYQEGYIQGNEEYWNRSRISPEESGLSLILDNNKQPLLVSVPIQDKDVFARVWQWKEGNASLYLLDTNISENDFDNRQITDKLYATDKEFRIKQEMVLGIGGFRLLQKLGINPSVYHINEGHPAFLLFELIKKEMDHNLSFTDACEKIKTKTIYTNHTLVSGGHHTFNVDLVSTMFSKYAGEFSISLTDILSLGLIPNSNLFSPTMLCLRLVEKINTVSVLHNEEAKKIWIDRQIQTVTNGVFLPRWDKINSIDKKTFWPYHQNNKRKLLKYIKEKSGEDWEENQLLIGWARRIVPYKRPLAIFEDLDNFKKLAQETNCPVKIIFAGLSHEGDKEGLKIFSQLQQIIQNELKGVAVFLKNYNLKIAELLVAGCDLWLNTPVVKSEACGTSGMKAALNCALPLTTRDGWIDEARLQDVGWVAHDPNLSTNLIKLLKNEIVPMYYRHLKNPGGSDWNNRMDEARNMIINNFSTTRVLRDYIEIMYLPVMEASKNRLAEHIYNKDY